MAVPATGTAFDHLFKIVLVGDSGVGQPGRQRERERETDTNQRCQESEGPLERSH
jgi:hypothetical protein